MTSTYRRAASRPDHGPAAPSGVFADASAVSRRGDGRWSARVADGWDIAGNANGGYLLAIAGRAMVEGVGRPDPVTVTAHYLAPGRPGDVTVDVSVVRQGRRFATASAVLGSDDRPLMSILGTFGDLADDRSSEADLRVDGGPPDLPAPETCIAMDRDDVPMPQFMTRVEMRLHPEDAGFSSGHPSGTPRMRGWFRLHDDERIDSIALLCAVDAFPPTIFNANLPVAWTPTIELTAHIRARPAPGWLACSFATRFVTGGFLEADGEVWDSRGRLMAQSRQLALVPRG